MGTTLTAMTTRPGVGLVFVVAIEGYEYLLTDGNAAAAATAWAATDWGDAISGLQILGGMSQELEPWRTSIDVPRISFAVMSDVVTTGVPGFGATVLGSGAGAETFLDTAIDCNDTTVSVLRADAFGASGNIHIGNECISYSSRDTGADTFTVSARGLYSPFKANSEANQRFGRAHRLPVIGEGVSIAPKVTSLQRLWVGRWVGIWAHSTTDGGVTLDVRAQAQCIFAGRITALRDDPNGLTYVDCDDVRGALRDCVLLRDQWTARVQEGIYLQAGWRFGSRDEKSATPAEANDLVVVASGASGNNEINAGMYTLPELINTINTWQQAERTAARMQLTCSLVHSGDVVQWSVTGSGSGINKFFFSAPAAVQNCLGWLGGANYNAVFEIGDGWTGTGAQVLAADEEPYRIFTSFNSTLINVEDERGTWVDLHTDLPAELGVTSTGNASLVQFGTGPVMVATHAAGVLTRVTHEQDFASSISGVPWTAGDTESIRRVRWSSQGELRLRQVIAYQSTFANAMTATACSTGTADYNYNGAGSTGDVLPAQLGAAIPWEILGTNWLTSLANVEEAHATVLLVIEKPTKWTEVFGIELAVRMLSLIWKNGGLVVRGWGTPTAAHSLHSFSEANKAVAVGTVDAHRTVANVTDDYLVNHIKLAYNRILSGGYQDTISLVDPSSQDDHGSRPVELSLRNTFSGVASSNSSINDLADSLAQTLSIFSRPLHLLRRTVSMPFYENCAPGDFCTVTDDFARDPATGARGLSSKPGLIVRHRADWGGYEIDTGSVRPPSAEIDILIMPLGNISAYCPAAEVDWSATNSGYDVALKKLTCLANAHSEAGETADAARFAVGDKVLVHEVDPADPASILSWSDTVAGQSGNAITLTTGLATWDNTKLYRVVSDTYSTAVTTQRANVYQADDADGMIADTINAYVYGSDPEQATSWTSESGNGSTVLPRLYSAVQYGDGRPLDTGAESDLARLCNSLVNYRTAPVIHSLSGTTSTYASGTGRKILEILPVYYGPGNLVLGERYLKIGVWARSSDGTSTTITVSLCRTPPTGSSLTSTDTTAMSYDLGLVYESWTSGAITATTYALFAHHFSARTLAADGTAYVVIEGEAKAQIYGVAQGQALAYEE